MNPPRRMRADAIRNRERILEAARVEVELGGTECSLDNVAKRAGVGPGTLYRHFPTRDDLVGALLLGWADEVRADTDATAGDTWDDVLEWLVRLADHAMVYRGLASTLAAAEADEASPLRSVHTVVLGAMSRLLDRARRSGVVTVPVDADEVSRLVAGIAMSAEQADLSRAQVRSMLAIVLNGLTQARPSN